MQVVRRRRTGQLSSGHRVAEATSYQLEVVQPALRPIDTNSPLPGFTAAGVPNGQYRVQVRAVNPFGTSAPSNVVDVIVGSSTPCATPAPPSGVTGSLVNGTASVSWPAVPGATSYIVRAGSTPGGSDLFNGNVGPTTSVSASGTAPGVPRLRARARGQRLRDQRSLG